SGRFCSVSNTIMFWCWFVWDRFLFLVVSDDLSVRRGTRSFRTCSFRTCSFRTCSFRTCSFRTSSFRTRSFRTCSFRTRSFRTCSFRTHSFRTCSVRNHSFRTCSFRNHSFRTSSFRTRSFRTCSFRTSVSQNCCSLLPSSCLSLCSRNLRSHPLVSTALCPAGGFSSSPLTGSPPVTREPLRTSENPGASGLGGDASRWLVSERKGELCLLPSVRSLACNHVWTSFSFSLKAFVLGKSRET
uniref:Uncharacterized protein n=1 Tax=Oryzias melastigma TaxID=30732 RepID=A0A3B3DC78_ORYME